jgi:outer membrane protein assembly factor BamB
MHRDASYASPTLACDGQHLVASFGSFGTFCLSLSGERLWEVDLGDLEIRHAFGEGSSPALEDGIVVQVFDHEGESFVVGLDAENGEELWRQDRPRGTNWTTPLITEVNDSFQVIVGAERVVGYDLYTGDEIWWLGEWPEGTDPAAPRPRGVICVMSSPVADGDLLVAHRGEELGLQAVSLADADGDLEGSEALRWTYQRDLPEVSSALLHQGRVYLVKANQGILTTLDATTGDKLYGPTRLQRIANIYASPIAAGDLVFLTGRDGEIEVLQSGSEFENLGVFEFEDRFDASPAIAGNQLFLRGHRHLYCFRGS